MAEGEAGAAAGAAATGTVGAEGAVTPAWQEGMDADARGFVQNKHWNNPGEMLSSYRTLEGFRGVPENQLVQLPADPDNVEQVNEFHRRLGRPDKPEGYELPVVEVPEGQENVLEPAFRKAAHDAGVSQKHASALYNWYVGHAAEIATKEQQAHDQQAQLAEMELKTEWGAEYEANMAHAKRFASVFGLSEDWLSQIEDASGTKGLYQGAAKIGRAISEHQFVAGEEPEGGAQPFGMTPQAAQTQIAELTANAEFLLPYQDKTHPGHNAAMDKMQKLQILANPPAAP